MQWLIHGNVSEEIAAALTTRGDVIHRAEASAAEEFLEIAHKNQWDLITTDTAMIHLALSGTVKFKRSIVHLQASQEAAIDRLFERFKRLTPLRLYTVTNARVKVRQLPIRITKKETI